MLISVICGLMFFRGESWIFLDIYAPFEISFTLKGVFMSMQRFFLNARQTTMEYK